MEVWDLRNLILRQLKMTNKKNTSNLLNSPDEKAKACLIDGGYNAIFHCDCGDMRWLSEKIDSGNYSHRKYACYNCDKKWIIKSKLEVSITEDEQ